MSIYAKSGFHLLKIFPKKKDGCLQHLWLQRMNNRTHSKDDVNQKKIERQNCVFTRSKREREEEALCNPTANLTDVNAQTSLFPFPYYVQRSVNPMRFQAVHTEKRH